MESPAALSRRNFLTRVAAGTALMLPLMRLPLPAQNLKDGVAPIPEPHFPNRLFLSVWRNWELANMDRQASAVGTKPTDILRMGKAMGLGKPPRITRDLQARSYLTAIKRNWHLLPYEQLLQLLDWTPEQMVFTLREDDFLYVKLGNLKPQCEPLRYQSPDAATLQRERKIAQIVAGDFPDAGREPQEELFGFVKDLARVPAKSAAPPPAADSLRHCYSYFALYGDRLLEKQADPYPEGLLARLAQAGVNGVWLQAVLHKVAPCTFVPGRSARYEERLKNLRTLVARAKRHGIQIFLYLNEPRAMPLSFFSSHPQLKDAPDGDHAALAPHVVKTWQGFSAAFSEFPYHISVV